jgi:hypothetical protein
MVRVERSKTLRFPWEWAIRHRWNSLSLYRRLQDWRRLGAERRPEESTGFRIIARRRAKPEAGA